MGIKNLVILGSFVFGSLTTSRLLWASPTFFQWVQSVPAETDLAVPGMALTADVWVEMIKSVKSTMDIAQFYVSANEKGPLEPVLEELEKAGNKRGVKIRFLVAHSLVKEDPTTIARLKRIQGLTLRIIDMSKMTGGVHHAKYWLMDGKEVFIGSQNFDWRSLNQIHEVGVRLRDPLIAKKLEHIFDLDWRAAQTREAIFVRGETLGESSGDAKIELLASPESLNPSDVRPTLKALVELFQSAKKTIRIQVLDYSPVSGGQIYWPDLDVELRAAALRGVKVQMLVSKGNSTLRVLDYLKSLNMIPGIEIKWVVVPPFSGGAIPYARLIHAKYVIVDDETFLLGNSNLSKGYFLNSRNVELLFRNSDWVEPLLSVFNKLWNHSYAEKLGNLTGNIK